MRSVLYTKKVYEDGKWQDAPPVDAWFHGFFQSGDDPVVILELKDGTLEQVLPQTITFLAPPDHEASLSDVVAQLKRVADEVANSRKYR